MIRVPVKNLSDYCKSTLTKMGISDRKADIVTECLIEANLRGVDSHGVRFLSIYVNAIRKGLINIYSEPKVERETPTTVLIDGQAGIGQVCGVYAVKKCIEKAKQHGMGTAGVRNSNHFGMAAYYAMLPVKEEMIGIALSNAPHRMVPWGAKVAYLGTNPFAVAVPTGGNIPFVVDMAVSKVALGKIDRAKDKGENIPEDWALDAEGNPTTDPKKALQGALLPMAEAKGYALSLLIDMFCGILTGAAFGRHHPNRLLNPDSSGPQDIGHLFAAIKIENFIPVKEFKERMRQAVEEIKSLPVAEGFSQIYIPGEIESNKRRERMEKGIPLNDKVISNLRALGKNLGLEFDKIS